MSDKLSVTNTGWASWMQALGVDLEASAHEHGALRRRRKIKTALQLFRMVMLYAAADMSLREIAADFAIHEERISDTAVRERLIQCRDWMRALTTHALQHLAPSRRPKDSNSILIYDGSCVISSGRKDLRYRLHLLLDLATLEIVAADWTSEHTPESIHHFQSQSHQAVMADACFSRGAELSTLREQGVHFINRYSPHHLPLYTEEGFKVKWTDMLKDLKYGEFFSKKLTMYRKAPRLDKFGRAVASRENTSEIVYVHGYHLPQEKANLARKRKNDKAKKKGKAARQETLLLGEWVLVVTSFPPELVSATQALSFYRLRWQIELMFKCLKSILNWDGLRVQSEAALVEVYLWGQSLYACRILHQARQVVPLEAELENERTLTRWRLWKMLHRHLQASLQPREIDPQRWAQALAVLQERRRKRTLQCTQIIRDLTQNKQWVGSGHAQAA